MPYIIREIAKSMDLDQDKVTNNMEEAARQAALMQPPAPPAGAPAEGAPPVPGASVADMTGGGAGNIGVGAAPVPGEQGFAGNTAGQPPQPPQAA